MKKEKDTQDVDPALPTRDEHAAWAGVAVEAYAKATGATKGSVLCDLLADLRHWADKEKLDWDDELVRANTHYRAELVEEKQSR